MLPEVVDTLLLFGMSANNLESSVGFAVCAVFDGCTTAASIFLFYI